MSVTRVAPRALSPLVGCCGFSLSDCTEDLDSILSYMARNWSPPAPRFPISCAHEPRLNETRSWQKEGRQRGGRWAFDGCVEPARHYPQYRYFEVHLNTYQRVIHTLGPSTSIPPIL